MPRKLTTLLCAALLLALLCACQSEPDTAIFCEWQSVVGWNFQVVELDERGGKRPLSDWAHYVVWQEPYLFHYVEEGGGWRVTSTAPDGSDEQLWLDSTQLPEEYAGYFGKESSLQFVDGVLYLMCDTSDADPLLVVLAPDRSVRFFPVEDYASWTHKGGIWNQSFYYMTRDKSVVVIDTNTGICQKLEVEPIKGLSGVFQIDDTLLWYLNGEYGEEYTLFGVNLSEGDVQVRADLPDWYLSFNTMFLHDGYFYYLDSVAAYTFSLWELPLAALHTGTMMWTELSGDGGAARLLAKNIPYDHFFPPMELCFGREGLWLCYSTDAETAARYDVTPGEIRYVPYGH